jgi:hypothetical protein
MRRPALLASLIAGLTLSGAAAGYVAGRVVPVKKGDTARFLPSLLSCNNHGGSIECFSGDALPYTILTGTKRGVTVIVHTLSGGGVQVRNVHHPAYQEFRHYDEIVYTFTAFP